MSDTKVSLMQPPEGYGDWLAALKKRIHTAQQKSHPGRQSRAGSPLLANRA